MSAAPGSEAPTGLPPGPDLPPSGQTARWVARPVEFLDSLRERHGDVFTIRLLRERPWVVVADPDLVKQIFTAPADVLHAGESKRILEPAVGSTSVLIEEGERHMRRRRLLLPPFHASRLPRYEATMRAAAEAELARWPLGVRSAAAPRMSRVALEVILRAVFSLEDRDGELEPLRAMLGDFLEYLSGSARTVLIGFGDSARLDRSRFAKLRRLLSRARRAVLAEVARRRAADDGREDVLSLLLEARFEDGSRLTDRELCDQLMTLVVAGHETTAASLSWALERLARDPEVLERAAAEVRAGETAYVDAVVKETLRLRPAFMVTPRVAVRSFQLGELTVPPGVAVTPGIPLVHRRPDAYPEPERFRPERFLERPPGTYTWIPFGGGVRRCIGAGFSLLEMRVVLSTLLERANVRVESGEPEVPARQGLVMAPAEGARIVLEPR